MSSNVINKEIASNLQQGKINEEQPSEGGGVSGGTTTAIQFNQEEQQFHKHLTLGIEEKLHRNRMIKEIKLIIRQPADKLSLSAWERKAGVALPSDLRDYYMSTNGFKLTWSLEHAGDILKIGEMNINSISHLISLDSPSPNTNNTNDILGEKTPISLASSSSSINTRPSSKSSSVLLDARKSSSGNLGTVSTTKSGKDNATSTTTGGITHNKFSSLKTSGSNNATNKSSKDSSAGNNKFGGNGESSQASLMYYQDLRQTMEANGQVVNKSQDFSGGLVLLPNDKAFILDSNQYGWVCLIYPQSNQMNHNQNSSTSPGTTTGTATVSNSSQVLNKTSQSSCENLKPKSSSHRSGSVTSTKSFPEKEDGSSPSLNNASPTTPTSEPPSVEIWFLDQSFQFHYLAPTFTHYYRMMLFHLGLPQWQYRFTPFGLSSWAEQTFWLVAPHLLTPPKISKFPSMYHAGGLWSSEVPTEAANPNPTLNVLTSQIFKRKKKVIEKDKQ